MCGIAGFINLKRRFGPDALTAIASRMADRLSHRGPDDRGVWIDAEAGIAFGHTRLAIVDLSPAGAQPMISRCGRFVVSYNGEIYNAPELRAELEEAGRAFRGHSDTEVMVEGFAVWGVRSTVERLIGMFAFAAWDRSTHTLTLGRDRLGIKPLYWGRLDDNLVFASELKALQAFPDWRAEIDRDALAAFLRYGYVPTPMSIYRGIKKLGPGTLLECGKKGKIKQAAYWSLSEVAARGQASLLDVPDAAAQEMLESLLADSVRRRMVADVPLGVFLSGGIDSSAVAALMQANSRATHPHLLDWLLRAGLRRSGPCQTGRSAFGHRAHRALRNTGRGPSRHSKIARHLRRALRQLLANSDLSRVGNDAASCDRRAFGRWRRRNLRGI